MLLMVVVSVPGWSAPRSPLHQQCLVVLSGVQAALATHDDGRKPHLGRAQHRLCSMLILDRCFCL